MNAFYQKIDFEGLSKIDFSDDGFVDMAYSNETGSIAITMAVHGEPTANGMAWYVVFPETDITGRTALTPEATQDVAHFMPAETARSLYNLPDILPIIPEEPFAYRIGPLSAPVLECVSYRLQEELYIRMAMARQKALDKKVEGEIRGHVTSSVKQKGYTLS